MPRGGLRNCLLQQLQLFPDELNRQEGEPRDIPTRPRQARHEPEPHWIAEVRHDDGDRRRGAFGSDGRWLTPRHDDANVETDQLGRQLWESFGLPLHNSALDGEVLALYIAAFPQPLDECLPQMRELWGGWRVGPEDTDSKDLRWLLRAASERRGEDA